MIRFLADEDFDFRIVKVLRRFGHDTATVIDFGIAGIGLPDSIVFQVARADRRTVLTHNRIDFRRIARASVDHFGVLLVRRSDDPLLMTRRILEAVADLGDFRNLIVSITRPPT